MRRWRRLAAAAVGLPLVALACNAWNGASDLDFAPPCVGCELAEASSGDAPPGPVFEASAPDASVDSPADAVVARPSFCAGIVMYAQFDGTLARPKGSRRMRRP